MSAPPIPLNKLQPGQTAVIVRVGGLGLIRRRLAELGFVPGRLVRVERVAPLGGPVEYRVMGYGLALRGEEAAQIEVAGALEGEHELP